MRCCHRKLSGRVQKGPRGGARSLANLPETLTLESILAERRVHQQEGLESPETGQARLLARDNQETHPITIKPEPRDRGVLLLLSTQAPLPSKASCVISICVSSDNSFPSVGRQSTPGPGRGHLPATGPLLHLSQGHCTSAAGHTAALLSRPVSTIVGAA